MDGEVVGVALEGLIVGGGDGNAGALVGRRVGFFVGRLVGGIKGVAVGADEGSLVGSSVGTYVGDLVDTVGSADKAVEGS